MGQRTGHLPTASQAQVEQGAGVGRVDRDWLSPHPAPLLSPSCPAPSHWGLAVLVAWEVASGQDSSE